MMEPINPEQTQSGSASPTDPARTNTYVDANGQTYTVGEPRGAVRNPTWSPQPGPAERVGYPNSVAPADGYVTPPAARRAQGINIVYLILSILETLLVIRFVLLLLGANPNASFSNLILTITAPFVALFANIFPNAQTRGSVFDVATLIALIVYPLVAWIIARIILATQSRFTSRM